MRTLLALFLLLSIAGAGIAQTDSVANKTYISKLKGLLNNQITEKAYLHFDKPYYAAGDTVYFKAYVTLGGQHLPSKLSGVLHVDLVNTANAIDQTIKLQLINGTAQGDFALADTLPKGNYRIRAYTQWMRNIGDDTFFEQVIPVGSLKNTALKAATNTPKQGMPDIQFFPEGGEFLEGVSTKVAFKAVNASGAGVDVKGILTDNTNKEVARFASAHLGMGFFNLLPEAGKTYSAKVFYADGSQITINLPKVKPEGIILTANNDSLAKISLKIITNKAYFEKNKYQEFTVKVVSGGKITSFKSKLDYEIMRFDVQKKNLRTGIAQITLYTANNEPLSERLLFVQSPDLLNVGINTDKQEYKNREKVNINITAKNQADQPSAGNFSVSVTDESKVPVDENNESTILTNLLLTTDLKGYVEQPNYYFADNADERISHLDILLLTQGYRNYVWKPEADSLIKYQPETQLQIAGKLKNYSGKQAVANGKLSLMSPDGGPVLSQTSGPQGEFAFPNLMFAGYTKFIVNGATAKGDNNVKISLDKEVVWATANTLLSWSLKATSDINAMMAPYLENSKQEQEDIKKYGSVNGIMLQEVKVKAKQIKTEPAYRTQSLAGVGNADKVIHMKDIQFTGPLSLLLTGRIGGLIFVNGVPKLLMNNIIGGRSMLVILDGLQYPPNTAIDNILSNDVETVEVLKYASTSIYGMEGGGGVLIITTKQGSGLAIEGIESKGIFPVVIKGFYKAREFYSPGYDYDIDIAKKPHADLRTTVFWKPNLITDKNGHASFYCYNADGKGNYRVVVEGFDNKGNLGRQVYRYKVN
ncbi:MAG: hypothetical protein JWR05_1755 [Mucilaginibacter sp.]|nr:hypothetical protein [Mucilaginibacter sp.]